jgi:uncharacterized membrane protein
MSKTIFKLALPFLMASACLGQTSISGNYTFQHVDYPNSIYSVPLGINNGRVIVGTYIDTMGVFHGYKWVAGTFTPIDYPGALGTTAGGINDLGEIAGTYIDFQGFQHGFKYVRLERCALSTATNTCPMGFVPIDYPGAAHTQVPFELGPGLGTAGIGINNFDQVTGEYAANAKYSNAFVEVFGSYKSLNHPLASHDTGNGTKCFGASNIGVLACDYLSQAGPMAPPITHGFLKDGSTLVPIDYPGAAALGFGTQISGVNIHNVAVGTYFDGQTLQALLWQAGQFYTVNFPGQTYNELHGINDHGDITGAFSPIGNGAVLFGYVAFAN